MMKFISTMNCPIDEIIIDGDIDVLNTYKLRMDDIYEKLAKQNVKNYKEYNKINSDKIHSVGLIFDQSLLTIQSNAFYLKMVELYNKGRSAGIFVTIFLRKDTVIPNSYSKDFIYLKNKELISYTNLSTTYAIDKEIYCKDDLLKIEHEICDRLEKIENTFRGQYWYAQSIKKMDIPPLHYHVSYPILCSLNKEGIHQLMKLLEEGPDAGIYFTFEIKKENEQIYLKNSKIIWINVLLYKRKLRNSYIINI